MNYGMTDDQVALARQVMALPGWGTIRWSVLRCMSGRKQVTVDSRGVARPIVGFGKARRWAPAEDGALLDVTDPGNAARLMERVGGLWWMYPAIGGVSVQHKDSANVATEASAATLCEAVCLVLILLGRSADTAVAR